MATKSFEGGTQTVVPGHRQLGREVLPTEPDDFLGAQAGEAGQRDQGAIISVYMDEGYAPEAVLNYLCLLGWSPKDNTEIMPLTEIIERFDLPGVLRSGAKFDMAKLQWMNWEYIRTMPHERYYDLAVHALGMGEQRVFLDVEDHLAAGLTDHLAIGADADGQDRAVAAQCGEAAAVGRKVHLPAARGRRLGRDPAGLQIDDGH